MLTILSEIYFGRRTSDWISKSQLDDVEFVKVMKKRIIKLLTLWITDYFVNFRDSPDLSRQFKEFLYELADVGKEEKRMADILLDTFMTSVEGAPSAGAPAGGEAVTPAAPMNKRRSGKNIFIRERSPRKLSFLDIDTKTLARQFCLFDQKLVARVRFQELVAGKWNKGKGENVAALRDRSNLITQWVATEILQTPNTKQRIVVLSNFLDLAINLLELRNFKTCFNVYHGLRMPQVARLTKTWNGLDPKTLAVWQDLELQLRGLAAWFDQTLASPSPKILPIPLLLRFLEVREQEPDMHRRYVHMINFNKMRAVADLVKPFIESQSVQYGFDENPALQTYLEKYLTVIDSQHKLNKLSKDIESDGTAPSATIVLSPRSKAAAAVTSSSSTSIASAPTHKQKSEATKAADATAKKVGATTDPDRPLLVSDPLNGKTRDQINVDIHNELVGKWKRPLTKCSVGSDLPRLIAKILVSDARGHTLYKCREDRKKIYLAREMHMFLRCMAQQLESSKDAKAIEKSFKDYFTIEARSEASTDIIKETGRFVSEILGEESIITSLLKVTASQGIISPAWVRLKLFILAGFPFKDARKGWRIYLIFEPFFVTICHIKKEMSSDQTTGSRHFEFTWELKMVFDRKLEQMLECSLVISELQISDDMPSDRQLQLTELVKPWIGPSFRSTIQYGLEGESEESSFMPEEAVAATNAKKMAATKSAILPKNPPSPVGTKKTQSEKKIVVENVHTGTARRTKSDAKIQTKKALITTPNDTEDEWPMNDSEIKTSPSRMKRRKSSKDKLEAKLESKVSDKEDGGYHSSGGRRSGSKEKHLAKSKSKEMVNDGQEAHSPARRTSSGDKNKILLATPGTSPGTSPSSFVSSSKRSGSLTKDETTKVVHHTPVVLGPAALAHSGTLQPSPILNAISPRRPTQNAISKASELLHDESESIDDAAIAHLRRLAPGSRGRTTSAGRAQAPTHVHSPPVSSRSTSIPNGPSSTSAPATPVAAASRGSSSPNLNKRQLSFGEVYADSVVSPTRVRLEQQNPSSSGAIAGSGSDESSSASGAGSGGKRVSSSSHDRLNTSVRKSLELKNLDVVRAFTEEAEAAAHTPLGSSARKKSARKSMPAQSSKTPRGSQRSAVASPSSGILSDEEMSPPSSGRLSVAAASVHVGASGVTSGSRASSTSSKHHQSPKESSSAGNLSGGRSGSSTNKHLKDSKERDRDRPGSKPSSAHRSSNLSTPREAIDSPRDRLDREQERERERQREREREERGDGPRSSSREAPNGGSPRSADRGSPRGSPRDGKASGHSSPGATDADAHPASGHLRRSRTSSRGSRDIRMFESTPTTPTQSTPTTPTAAESASEAGDDKTGRRRPRAPSLGVDGKSISSNGSTMLATVEETSPRRDSESAGRVSGLPVPPPPVSVSMISSRYSAPDLPSAGRSPATSPTANAAAPPAATTPFPPRQPSAVALAAAAPLKQTGLALAEWDVTDSSVSDVDESGDDPFR